MKTLISSIILFQIVISANAQTFFINSKVLRGNSVPFIAHAGAGQFDNYLAMNLPLEPVADLFKQIIVKEKRPMTSRGETHITVITPIEYWNILRPRRISIKEISALARRMKIQNSKIEISCLGVGKAKIGNMEEKTYYVVVESQDLISIRQEIQKLVVARGGLVSDFDPYNFHPHITVGFTLRDLHESDGVIKNINSCLSSLKILAHQRIR